MRKAPGTTGSIVNPPMPTSTPLKRGEQRLAVAIEPCPACFPIRSEPFHLPEPLGERLRPQCVKANWQGIEHALEFERIIGGLHASPRSRCSADEMECLSNVRFRRTLQT
jgi:hypothetical protein